MASEKESSSPKEQKPQKSHKAILQHTIETALTQFKRDNVSLAISGLSAGLDIGFSVLLMAIILSLFSDVLPDPYLKLLLANVYPIGFIFVILGRSELFTEHTTLAVLPVLHRLTGVKQLFRLWALVYFSNIIGGLVFGLILSYFAEPLHFLQGWALKEIAQNVMDDTWQITLVSAILAGWLMGLLAWLVAAVRETISQIFIIWLVTASIGICELHHCIVGNVEMLTSLLSEDFSILLYLKVLAIITLGNTIGGVIFVAILKYSHTANSKKEEEVDDLDE